MTFMPFWVDPDPLRESVRDKARKYRELVQHAQLPLVVCVVPDFMTARGLDEVHEAVLGKEQCGGSNGLFARYPTLSAVTLGEWYGDRLVHTLLANPSATYPLAEGVLGSCSAPSSAV
jgi:hypothetical protein